MNPLEGMLVVDKPTHMTSFDVVRRLRRPLKMRAVGHTGTLDPNASGVLCVCLGWALKLIRFLDDDHKVYDAVAKLGETTDTDDAEGRVIASSTVDVAPEEVAAALKPFIGAIEQRPPAYSAVKVGGKRAYTRARRGDRVVLPLRAVRIDAIADLEVDLPLLRFRLTCGRGTYVRSLCRDLGERLGCGAHLHRLRRLESGRANVREALTPDEIEESLESGRPPPITRCYDMLDHLPAVPLDPTRLRAVQQGQWPPISAVEGLKAETLVRVVAAEAIGEAPPRLEAVAKIVDEGDGPRLRPVKVRPG